MENADSGIAKRIEAMSPELAPIIEYLIFHAGLVGACEKAVNDIEKVFERRLKKKLFWNNILWCAWFLMTGAIGFALMLLIK